MYPVMQCAVCQTTKDLHRDPASGRLFCQTHRDTLPMNSIGRKIRELEKLRQKVNKRIAEGKNKKKEPSHGKAV